MDIGRRAAVAILAAALATGCSTVIRTASSEGETGAAEREALAEAAAEIAPAPWPKPSTSNFADRLGAGPGSAAISRKDAIGAYVAILAMSADAEQTLSADAARHLDAAGRLTTAAELACDSPRPRLADVALIEEAIADLRQTRSIYLAAIDEIDGDDVLADRLKRDFDAVIKNLGAVADDLAANAMKRRTENLAGPGSADVKTGAI